MKLTIQSASSDKSIAHFVHSFWMMENNTDENIPSIVLPNGMVDMAFMKIKSGNWEMMIRGIDTKAGQVVTPAGTKMFSIGFKLLAVEYLFKISIKEILNESLHLSNDVWQFTEADLSSLKNFCKKATQKIKILSTEKIDSRKKELFECIYKADGSISITPLSKKVFWSSRQINRYFNNQFGISLKAYCNILRFGASFKHISEGKLFPEQSFADQSHFIKEIKKYAGVTPKELSKNKNERFVDLASISSITSENG